MLIAGWICASVNVMHASGRPANTITANSTGRYTIDARNTLRAHFADPCSQPSDRLAEHRGAEHDRGDEVRDAGDAEQRRHQAHRDLHDEVRR